MATTKQFGISGVGSDLQLGKGGGRFVYDEGVFKITTDGTTLGNVRTALPTNANDAANKAYVDSLSAGLDPKESVRAATTANITLTDLQTVDGVSLVAGNRVLVKNQTDPIQNGIYVVVDGGAWTRATDFDGADPSNEVSGGAFTFVEAGTVNINSGFVVSNDGVVAVGTDAINFVQFSGAGSIGAGAGIRKTGSLLSVDLFDNDVDGPLPAFAGTADDSDLLLFGKSGDNTTHSITVGKLFDDMDTVSLVGAADSTTGITGNGFLVRTADDTYAIREIAVSGAGAEAGLTITDAAANAGNPTLGLDITGTAAAGTLAGTEEFLVFDGINNVKTTIGAILADQDVVTADDALTGMVQITNGVLTSTSVTASAVAGDEGISVTGGDTAPVIGLDITGLTAETTEIVDTDEIVFFDGLNNLKATALQLKNYAQSGLTQNSIQLDDSSVVITDDGLLPGTITFNVDGTNTVTITDGVTQFAGEVKLKASEIDNGIVHVLADGTLETTAGFTFDGTNMAVPADLTAVGNITAASFTGAGLTNNAMLVANASSEIISQTNVVYSASALAVTGAITSTADITATANIAGVNGTFSGTVGGTTITASTGFVDINLANGELLTVNGSGEIVSSGLSVGTDTLTIGNITIDGSAGTGNVISTTNTDGDLVLAPNGAGDVVIGNSGVSTQIVAEDDQSLTLSGGASSDGIVDAGAINLLGGDSSGAGAGGDVVVQAGTSTSGTSGTTQFIDANDNLVAEIVNSPASTDGHIDISAGASLAAEGTGTDIDLALVPKGTGTVTVPAGYEGRAGFVDDSLVNKQYVDEQIAGNVVPGSVGSVSATVDLATAGTVTIGTIPANATVFEVRVNVTTASDATTLVDIGDGVETDRYMTDAEIDAEATGLYSADCFVTIGGADETANATVATPGTTGSATVIVFYRNA